MKKKLKMYGALLAVIVITYAFAWGQMYITSKKYYSDAMNSYNKRDYAVAIKGKKIQGDNGYTFNGGYEQVIGIWKSSYALPKPKVYKDANKMIDEIINEKLDIKTGTDMFNRYLKMDNKGYLDVVMLRVADLYVQDNDIADAKETLEIIKEAFPNNVDTQKIVKEKLDKLK